MKHFFIINPAAGSRDQTKDYQAKIQAACRGLDYRIAVSAAPGECRRLAREAAQAGEECRIYACGGDGTLNEVAAGAAGYGNAAVTMLAGGSGNDFVRIFSNPSAFRSLERLLDARVATMDLIRCNDDLALNVCSVGLDARIGTDVARYKRLPLLHGFSAYAASTVVNVIRGIGAHYVVKINGETIDGRQTFVCVCNGRYYGGGFNPVPQADPADGRLNVLLVRQVSRRQVPLLIGRYKAGRYSELGDLVRYFETDHLEVTCDEPSAVNLDGELLIADSLNISVAKEKIRFFYPKDLTWRREESLQKQG